MRKSFGFQTNAWIYVATSEIQKLSYFDICFTKSRLATGMSVS